MGRVVAVCRSEKKGEPKRPIPQGKLIMDWGLEGDAHAGGGNRQLSLLAWESIAKMRERGFELGAGDFAENITTQGIDLASLPIGTRLLVGPEVVLEITQIGKECHGHRCAVYRRAGDCVMPREGVFARIICGGQVAQGDEVRVLGTGVEKENGSTDGPQ